MGFEGGTFYTNQYAGGLPPKEAKLVDYNPDHQPSSSRIWVEERDGNVYEVLHIRDCGALVFRVGTGADGQLVDREVSSFTDSEIGWRK